jgi:hypothetical protein
MFPKFVSGRREEKMSTYFTESKEKALEKYIESNEKYNLIKNNGRARLLQSSSNPNEFIEDVTGYLFEIKRLTYGDFSILVEESKDEIMDDQSIYKCGYNYFLITEIDRIED